MALWQLSDIWRHISKILISVYVATRVSMNNQAPKPCDPGGTHVDTDVDITCIPVLIDALNFSKWEALLHWQTF